MADSIQSLLQAALATGQTPDQLIGQIRKAEREKIISAAKMTIPMQTLASEEFSALISGVLDGQNVGDTQDAYRSLISAMRRGDQQESWAALLVFLKAFRYEHMHWEHVPDNPPTPTQGGN